jgi:hypothetical protein
VIYVLQSAPYRRRVVACRIDKSLFSIFRGKIAVGHQSHVLILDSAKHDKSRKSKRRGDEHDVLPSRDTHAGDAV